MTAPLYPWPPQDTLNTLPVLTVLVEARAALGELRGRAKGLPNQEILLNTLFLQEALASSKIENIVTTQDEAFRASLFTETGSVPAKEVVRYVKTMQQGYKTLRQQGGIGENMLIEMFRTLKQRDGGYRKTPGTVLKNEKTGETVYTPPSPDMIIPLMRDLEVFINEIKENALDPLIKMALIHHRFESIHPFPDGNGRLGRMLNVLYLTHAGLLDAPILYLSRAINQTRLDYYRHLQAVRDEEAWEDWIIYILNTVKETARFTLYLVDGISDLMQKTKHRLRKELPKIYSQDLLNNLFRYPYTRIDYLQEDLPYGWQTARKYLKELSAAGFVVEEKQGRNKYYINRPLVDFFLNVSEQ